jgi:hypothetical protein
MPAKERVRNQINVNLQPAAKIALKRIIAAWEKQFRLKVSKTQVIQALILKEDLAIRNLATENNLEKD